MAKFRLKTWFESTITRLPLPTISSASLMRPISLLHRLFQGPAVMRQVAIVVVIPAAHRVHRQSIAIRAEHLVYRHAGTLAQNVPYRDVRRRERELRSEEHTSELQS